jgi:RNA polymerase sigma factor (sigma-70 family)
MQSLSPESREILLLHYTNGLTFLEIGEMLGQPQNTVKSRHHRAVLSLRKVLSTTQGYV